MQGHGAQLRARDRRRDWQCARAQQGLQALTGLDLELVGDDQGLGQVGLALLLSREFPAQLRDLVVDGQALIDRDSGRSRRWDRGPSIVGIVGIGVRAELLDAGAQKASA